MGLNYVLEVGAVCANVQIECYCTFIYICTVYNVTRFGKCALNFPDSLIKA